MVVLGDAVAVGVMVGLGVSVGVGLLVGLDVSVTVGVRVGGRVAVAPGDILGVSSAVAVVALVVLDMANGGWVTVWTMVVRAEGLMSPQPIRVPIRATTPARSPRWRISSSMA